MGVDIERERFDRRDFELFARRLDDNLSALSTILGSDRFGEGPLCLGAELELFLVDAACQPSPCGDALLACVAERDFSAEIDRFNIECNTDPCDLDAAPFANLGQQLSRRFETLARQASPHGARPVMIGILPTLDAAHLRGSMTDTARYRALSRQLRERRRAPFQLRIDGIDPLTFQHDDITLEGAATSLQIHLRVPPADFARVYNAVQLSTAPALAVAGNSPLLLGHRLWEETRVALFKQSVDERSVAQRQQGEPARVSFGHGWLQSGAYELFEQNVRHFEPILPLLGPQAPLEVLAAGRLPTLSELRLHSGTVWRWNRPVYDTAGGGHVRIEMRALPAGPTIADMQSNAAFLVGLALALANDDAAPHESLPFTDAESNFYAAARDGLDATLRWPTPAGIETTRAGQLAQRLLPVARRGLLAAGVADADYSPHLERIEERIATGQTGARWQRARFEQLLPSRSREEALRQLVEEYIEHSAGNTPAHRWPR